MEMDGEDRGLGRPKVLSAANFAVAGLLHVAFFALFFAVAWVQGLFAPRETVIPIDLTLVVNENLDGVDDEPPPLQNPATEKTPPPEEKPAPEEPPAPQEEKKEEPKAEPPKVEEPVLEEPKVDLKKLEEERKKAEEAKRKKAEEDRKKAEADKKKAEAEKKKKEAEKRKKREDRLAQMRKSATKNTKPVKIETKGPSGNGRTGKQTLSEAEIRKLLGQGYKPGREESLATSDLQLGVSLIQMALNEKWDALAPKVGQSGTVLLSCRISSAGGLSNVRLEKSCGDRLSDEAALSVARRVTFIRNLPEAFKARFAKETLTIRYEVKGL